MKRTYNKPRIAVESFQLDATIAGACANKVGAINQSESMCVFDSSDTGFDALGGVSYFGSNACRPNIVDEKTDGMYCYHGPNGLAQITDVILTS